MTKQASYDTYIFYLENGNSISKMFGLEEIVFPPYTKYCIRASKTNRIELNQSKFYLGNQYEILKEVNILSTIRIGDFEATNIGADELDEGTKKIFLMIIVKNHRNGIKQNFRIYLDDIANNVLEEIVLILSKLDKLGSYEAYSNSILLEKLQAENARLKRQLSGIQAKMVEIKDLISNP